MSKKPTLVIVQSYYDRDPTPSRCQAANEPDLVDNKDGVVYAKCSSARLDKNQHGVEGCGSSNGAPPPPPMPAASLDKSQPPPSPTPDYDSLSISSGSSLRNPSSGSSANIHSTQSATQSTDNKILTHNIAKLIPNESVNQQVLKNLDNTNAKLPSKKIPSQNVNGNKYISDGDRVEMISIESFTLTNPSSPKPKPPATYFGTMSGLKKPKPSVAVTIGEYPTDCRRPNKFHFLVGNMTEEKGANQQNGGKQCGQLLQSELVQTLSRSNLKKQTETKTHHSNGSSKETAPPKETVTISVHTPASRINFSTSSTETTSFNFPSSSHGPVNVEPSIKAVADKIASTLNNRLMIRIADASDGNDSDRCQGTGPISGILKNVNCTSVTNVNNGKHKNVIQQKSISFGEITTVISDVPQ